MLTSYASKCRFQSIKCIIRFQRPRLLLIDEISFNFNVSSILLPKFKYITICASQRTIQMHDNYQDYFDNICVIVYEHLESICLSNKYSISQIGAFYGTSSFRKALFRMKIQCRNVQESEALSICIYNWKAYHPIATKWMLPSKSNCSALLTSAL